MSEPQTETKPRTPQKPSPPKFDPSYVNAMSHFYRGELGRIMSWRQRLDTTTSWAITVTSTIFTVAFSIEAVPHIIFFFNIAIVWMMLWIEARRYRFYDAFRARVRMLEAHFLVPIVAQNDSLLQGEWQRLVCEDLLLPSFKISSFEAVGRRLKRNYVFIFLIILVAWLTKIFLHANPAISSWDTFYTALRVGTSIPGWLVGFIFAITFVAVLGITTYIAKRTTGEISEFGTHRSAWRI
ncbi:MAG: DUF2270 domain-containing protein [Verrucomicrobiota bacterium]|nr:DUF2270 domain-containing protein [Verrucomicrobiota bacterium]